MEQRFSLQQEQEVELLKQLILAELFELLSPQVEGEFSYVMTGGGEDGLQKITPAIASWYEHIIEQKQTKNSALYSLQKNFLQKDTFLSPNLLALYKLSLWKQKGVNINIFMAEENPQELPSIDKFYPEATRGLDFRVYQMIGNPTHTLRNMAYGGIISSPSIALINLPEGIKYFGGWLSLIETFLLRGIWVVLAMPKSLFGLEISSKQAYKDISASLQRIKYEILSFSILEQSEYISGSTKDELWVLSPDNQFAEFKEKIMSSMEGIFNFSKEKELLEPQKTRIDIQEISPLTSKLKKFEESFPRPVGEYLEVTIGKRDQISSVIELWKQLMDEHIEYDRHFKRRSIAELYIQQSFVVQIPNQEYLLLIAHSSAKVIGFLTAQVIRAPLFETLRTGQVVDVFVAPEWRGHGVGKMLFQASLDWFEVMSLGQIDLNVARGNKRGIQFWQSMGFDPYLYVVSRSVKEL